MSISQIISDKYILDSIGNYFGVGRVYLKNGVAQLEINNFKWIQHIILPFFTIYPLMGHKRTQYEVWLEAITITLCTPGYSKERETKLLDGAIYGRQLFYYPARHTLRVCHGG
jgi:hypothetical protein